MPRMLSVGTDGESVTYLPELLQQEGFEIRHAADAFAAINEVAVWQPDVILVEMLFADAEGLAVCRSLRQASDSPIVVCSPSSRESDIVRALEAGADDYLVMPVRPVELLARLRAVLRRVHDVQSARPGRDRLMAGNLEIKLDEHRAYKNGVALELSPIEFRLLVCLMRQAGRVVSHSKLMAQVWGPEYAACRHYLRLYVRYLRSKIEDNPQDPKLILSEWGVGYRLQPSQGWYDSPSAGLR